MKMHSRLSGAIFACFCESLLVWQSQGRSGSAGRFPGLLTHELIREATLEAQGEGLYILLILLEGTERPVDGNRYPMYIRNCLC